jgi:phosphate acetyltransferase
MHTFLLAPTGPGVGLTLTALGLGRGGARAGLRVGFCQPVAKTDGAGPDLTIALMESAHGIRAPSPLSLAHVKQRLGQDRLDELLEEIISLHRQAAEGVDVVIIEGLTPSPQADYAAKINVALTRSLNADGIVVTAAEGESAHALANELELRLQQSVGLRSTQVIDIVVNKVVGDGYASELCATPPFANGRLRLLGCIPWRDDINAPRAFDIAERLRANVLNAGDYKQRRVEKAILFARAMHSSVQLLKPGVLVVAPGDREDIVVAACLAAMNGVPLAGLLLCADCQPDANVLELCRGALQGGLPVLTVASGSYDTVTALDQMNKQIPLDDRERAEKVTEFVAGCLDQDWLHTQYGAQHETRLTPAAFRYQLVKQAQAANKRIVLPEGAEPRTVQAAAICQSRGIARCVLLACEEDVREVARAQGVTLPPGLEILDPEVVRERYVEPMVALRKGKGLSAPVAAAQLEDNVVLATMMLALDEVDGLVSGAVHTTANTIRPALQLIKTAPGYKLVSSVFFMLLPDQVVVYGDCAVNPDPKAADLAEIAMQSAASAAAFGIPPRVAMLSYSTGSSGSGEDVEKVREATRLAHAADPELAIDGPLQYDAASVAEVGKQKAPDSPVAGQATVFIFPDLNTGNTTYKAVQRSSGCLSVGPMLQGLRKPVNDLSRGALVEDIVFTIALTAIQAVGRVG